MIEQKKWPQKKKNEAFKMVQKGSSTCEIKASTKRTESPIMLFQAEGMRARTAKARKLNCIEQTSVQLINKKSSTEKRRAWGVVVKCGEQRNSPSGESLLCTFNSFPVEWKGFNFLNYTCSKTSSVDLQKLVLCPNSHSAKMTPSGTNLYVIVTLFKVGAYGCSIKWV